MAAWLAFLGFSTKVADCLISYICPFYRLLMSAESIIFFRCCRLSTQQPRQLRHLQFIARKILPNEGNKSYSYSNSYFYTKRLFFFRICTNTQIFCKVLLKCDPSLPPPTILQQHTLWFQFWGSNQKCTAHNSITVPYLQILTWYKLNCLTQLFIFSDILENLLV